MSHGIVVLLNTFFWFALNYWGDNYYVLAWHCSGRTISIESLLGFYWEVHSLTFFSLAIVSIEQPPPRSWIPLQEPDRTRPAGETLSLQFRLCCRDLKCTICCFTSLLPRCINLDKLFSNNKKTRNILWAQLKDRFTSWDLALHY